VSLRNTFLETSLLPAIPMRHSSGLARRHIPSIPGRVSAVDMSSGFRNLSSMSAQSLPGMRKTSIVDQKCSYSKSGL